MTAAAASEVPTTFEELGLLPELLDALTRLGYEEPTGVQAETIPPLLEGRETLLEDDLEHVRVVVETLADEFDVMDIAAAAVKLAHAAPAPKRGVKGRASRGTARRDGGETSRIFISAGRQLGVRPQDLVGAIANEAGISVRGIGAIEIADRFSFVELNEDVIPAVIDALRATKIKGRKVSVSRERVS